MLKTKTIKTDKANLLVVELPEYYRVYHRANGTIFCSNVRNKNANPVWDSSDGNWKLLGRLPEITEEQSKKIVDKHFMDGCRSYDIYRDYLLNSEDGRWVDDSLESLYSLLQANDVCFENRLGEEPDISASSYTDMFTIAEQSRKHLQWELEQAKVWDKERCYLLIKVD